MADEAWFPEPFGAEYAAPAPVPCPGCPCCSARLCQTGNCLLMAPAEDKQTVQDCPCDQGRLAAGEIRRRHIERALRRQCHHCGAAPGKPCVSDLGGSMESVHMMRMKGNTDG